MFTNWFDDQTHYLKSNGTFVHEDSDEATPLNIKLSLSLPTV